MWSACAYIEGTSVPEFSEDGETYELQWAFDVRFLADEPYHSLTPPQPSAARTRGRKRRKA
jgi:hypothetical protein